MGIADFFHRPHQHWLFEVCSCGSCLGQLHGGETQSFTEKLNGTTHIHTHTQAFHKCFASFAQAQNSSKLSSLNYLKPKSKTCLMHRALRGARNHRNLSNMRSRHSFVQVHRARCSCGAWNSEEFLPLKSSQCLQCLHPFPKSQWVPKSQVGP